MIHCSTDQKTDIHIHTHASKSNNFSISLQHWNTFFEAEAILYANIVQKLSFGIVLSDEKWHPHQHTHTNPRSKQALSVPCVTTGTAARPTAMRTRKQAIFTISALCEDEENQYEFVAALYVCVCSAAAWQTIANSYRLYCVFWQKRVAKWRGRTYACFKTNERINFLFFYP